MSRKAASRTTPTAASASSSTKPTQKTKLKSAPAAIEKLKPLTPAGRASPPPGTANRGPGAPAISPAGTPAPAEREAAHQLLNRAERDIASAIESLNNQMNAALTALAELAATRADRGKAVVRTAPLDRATATFQRLVAEVVDDQFAEMLPPLIALRGELRQWVVGDPPGSSAADFHQRGVETLDGVLALAGVTPFNARPGERFDALIHLAVGETRREDSPDGTIAECVQPGFRSARGKVLAPARVRINRR